MMLYKFSEFIFIFSLIQVTCSQGPKFPERRQPNNSRCTRNDQCISDCCIYLNGSSGKCVGRPSLGQVCGLANVPGSRLPESHRVSELQLHPNLRPLIKSLGRSGGSFQSQRINLPQQGQQQQWNPNSMNQGSMSFNPGSSMQLSRSFQPQPQFNNQRQLNYQNLLQLYTALRKLKHYLLQQNAATQMGFHNSMRQNPPQYNQKSSQYRSFPRQGMNNAQNGYNNNRFRQSSTLYNRNENNKINWPSRNMNQRRHFNNGGNNFNSYDLG